MSENDRHPFEKFLKIMKMESIYEKQHEMNMLLFPIRGLVGGGGGG